MSLGFPLQDNIVIWLYNALQQRYMVLTEVAEPMIETAWQGVDELTFTIRADDPRSAYLLPDQLIEYPEGKFWINANYQDNTEGPLRTIKAKARWHQLTWITKNGVRSLLGKTPLEGLTQILQGSGWTVGSVPADAELYTYEDIDPTVLEFARAWAQVTGYDLQFDTAAKTVSMVEQDGEERDVGFFYGSNMESVTRNFTPPQVTRLYPYGANNLDISAVNPTGLNYIENYDWYIDNFGLTVTQARNLYRKDWTWKDDRFFTAVPLYDAAVGYLNQLSLPQISYSGKVIDFTRLTNITVDDCQAGDLVRVTDEILGYTALTKVTRTIRHPMSPDQDEVELELFTNNGLDVLNEERTIDYDQIQLIVNTNDSPVAVTASLTAVNQVSVTTSGSAIVVASGHIVAQAAGAGTVQFQFQIDGANYGEPVLKDFTDLEQIEHSWVTFADGLDEGAHTLSWLMNVTNVVSGAGELLVDSNDARAVVWLSGGLGVGIDLSPNQYLIEVLPAFTELDGIIAATPNDVTLIEFIHNADDIVDQNFTVPESLTEWDELDGIVDAVYAEEAEPFLVEQVFVFGVWWVANSPETQSDGTGTTVAADVPTECQADDEIVVFLYHRSGADNITPPTIGAVTFTRVAQTVADDGTFEQWTEVWTATDDGTMANETLTFTGTLSERMGIMVAVLRNAEGGTVAVDTVATYGNQNAAFTDPHPELVPNIAETDPFRLGVMFISCAYAETSPTETEYTLAYSTPVNTVPPVASSTDPGEYTAVLSTTDGTWVGDDGNRAYRWYLVSDDSTLPGTADESSYTPDIVDYGTLAGQDVGVEVTTTNSHGTTTVSSNTVNIPGTIDIFGDDLVDGGAPGETATSFLDGGSAGGVPKSAVDGQDEAALPTDSPVMDMGWYSLYWTEGDEFVALGLADGATVTAWPDEIGSNDLTQISLTPNKVAASALFNNMPAVNYAAGERHEATSSHTACRGFVGVIYLPGTGTNRFIDSDGDSGRYIPGMLYSGTYQFFADGSAQQTVTYATGVPHLFVAYVNGSTSYLEIDGAPVYTNVNVGSSLISQLQLGSSGHAGATLPLVGLFAGDPKADPKWAEFEQWVEDHYGIPIA